MLEVCWFYIFLKNVLDIEIGLNLKKLIWIFCRMIWLISDENEIVVKFFLYILLSVIIYKCFFFCFYKVIVFVYVMEIKIVCVDFFVLSFYCN